MIDWPAECDRMEAEACGDIAGPDYADPVRNSPRMFLWALVGSAALWALICWCVWRMVAL